tara:strand:- start:173 stop:1006 length:834 start_codon:yes stop_codon:yes gene_type:complete
LYLSKIENNFNQCVDNTKKDFEECYMIHVYLLLDLSSNLGNEEQYVTAITYLDKMLDLLESKNKIVEGQIFLNKAILYQNMKEYDLSVEHYNKVLEIEPTHSQAILNLGILYQETKQWEKSIEMFEKVINYPGEDVSGYIRYSQERLDANQRMDERGGGCLIATATYGSELAPQVQQLRELRDNQLLQTESGTQFMGIFNDIYYSFSPTIADYERENPYFKEAVKLGITPMISSLSLMENAESESEVLSIGISVIMLNLGMYLGVPAIVIIGIRKIK